jgi:hypothetical protein
MLGSITPLGERGRGRRWGWTATLYVAASAVAGTAVGAAVAWLGAPLVGLVPAAPRLAALAAAIGIGAALDAQSFGLTLPTPRRQLNDEWLTRYRGWVVGVGFGAQLGAGVVTIVTSSTTYAALVAAALSGRPAVGAAIGGTYGSIRGVAIALVAGVRHPAQLGTVDAMLRRWDRVAATATLAGQGALVVGALTAAVRTLR